MCYDEWLAGYLSALNGEIIAEAPGDLYLREEEKHTKQKAERNVTSKIWSLAVASHTQTGMAGGG